MSTRGHHGLMMGEGGGAPVAYTAMNPSDKASGITLAGGNLVVTSSGSVGIVRSVSKIVGKRYFEAKFTGDLGASASVAAGVANSSHSLSASLGFSNPNGWAFWGPSGYGARHNGATAVIGSVAAGDVIGFAVDQSTGKMWISKNGTWIAGNPAAGTGAIWSNVTGEVYAATCPWFAGATITMRFDPAQFSYPAPSGFSPITA